MTMLILGAVLPASAPHTISTSSTKTTGASLSETPMWEAFFLFHRCQGLYLGHRRSCPLFQYDYFDKAVEEALGDEYYNHLRESWIRILKTWRRIPSRTIFAICRWKPWKSVSKACVQSAKSGGDAQFPRVDGRDIRRGHRPIFHGALQPQGMGVPLETMGKEWLGERVSVVDLVRIERNIVEQKDDVNWGPNNRFKFPKSGGTGPYSRELHGRSKTGFPVGMNSCPLTWNQKRSSSPMAEGTPMMFLSTPFPLTSLSGNASTPRCRA